MQTSSMGISTGEDRPVRPWLRHAPAIITIGAIMILALHGRIAQPDHYNEFADRSAAFGIPHAADVLSNAGFALVAIWGWLTLWPHRASDQLRAGWPGYSLFLIGLLLTAFGSAWYHLAPDNARLISDRLPIALACAGLLAGVRGDTQGRARASPGDDCVRDLRCRQRRMVGHHRPHRRGRSTALSPVAGTAARPHPAMAGHPPRAAH